MPALTLGALLACLVLPVAAAGEGATGKRNLKTPQVRIQLVYLELAHEIVAAWGLDGSPPAAASGPHGLHRAASGARHEDACRGHGVGTQR